MLTQEHGASRGKLKRIDSHLLLFDNTGVDHMLYQPRLDRLIGPPTHTPPTASHQKQATIVTCVMPRWKGKWFLVKFPFYQTTKSNLPTNPPTKSPSDSCHRPDGNWRNICGDSHGKYRRVTGGRKRYVLETRKLLTRGNGSNAEEN